MSICGKLSIDLGTDCNYPLVSGVVDRAILANFDDVVISYDVNGVATDIVITSGRAYILEGKNSSIDVKSSLIESRFAETYDHVLMAKIFNNNGLAKKTIEDLSKGRFIVIVENNFKGLNGQSSFEIFGANVGLELKEATQDKSDSETQGAWNITLGSNENFREPLPQASFFDTSYATSKAKIEALLGPDSTAPQIQSASTNTSGTQIIAAYNEALYSTPSYTVSGGKTITSQVISGSNVIITVTPAYVNGDVITISGGGVTDLTGNAVATLTNYAVTNNVGATPQGIGSGQIGSTFTIL